MISNYYWTWLFLEIVFCINCINECLVYRCVPSLAIFVSLGLSAVAKWLNNILTVRKTFGHVPNILWNKRQSCIQYQYEKSPLIYDDVILGQPRGHQVLIQWPEAKTDTPTTFGSGSTLPTSTRLEQFL